MREIEIEWQAISIIKLISLLIFLKFIGLCVCVVILCKPSAYAGDVL